MTWRHQLMLDPLHYGAIWRQFALGLATIDEAYKATFAHLVERGWLPRRLTVTDGRVAASLALHESALERERP